MRFLDVNGHSVSFGTPEQQSKRSQLLVVAVHDLARLHFGSSDLLESAVMAALLVALQGIETDEGLDQMVSRAWDRVPANPGLPFEERRERVRKMMAEQAKAPPVEGHGFSVLGGVLCATLVFLARDKTTLTQLQADVCQGYHSEGLRAMNLGGAILSVERPS